jgi:hypothetical protein
MDASALDAATIAALTSQTITILTPFAAKAEEAFAGKVGEAAFEQGKRLYEAIRSRFAKEPDHGKSSKVLDNFTADPDEYTINLENKLLTLLQADPDFARILSQILQSGPIQSIEIGDDAIAEGNSMKNRLGKGSQTMRGGRGSRLSHNTQEMG